MRTKTLIGIAGIAGFSLFLGVTAIPSYGASVRPIPKMESFLLQYVNGTVTKITGGLVFLKTDVGPTRSFSLKMAMREGIENVQKGDRLRIEVEAGNQIIDVKEISNQGLNKFYIIGVRGKVLHFTPETKMVTLRLPDTRTIRLGVKEVAASKMLQVKAQTHVELKIDEDNHLVKDFMRL